METRCIIVVLRRGLSLDMSEGPPASLWHLCALRCTKACFGAEKITLGNSPMSAVLLLHVSYSVVICLFVVRVLLFIPAQSLQVSTLS